ncbi:hypothetical protein CPB86DRAFT_789341 [Serendipita vermifera]|nr:hypothetical protein CPB86DRAFT_789341 [Serendipita vermifera]
MQTRPLPNTISRLFYASYATILLAFICSMINLGGFSLFIMPISCFLTAVYHITLVILSRRKVQTPPESLTTNYPSYTINVANCTIVFLLALLWVTTSWLPILWAAFGELEENAKYTILPIIEGSLGYLESALLFALFGVCVHHRKRQLRNKEFIRMEG